MASSLLKFLIVDLTIFGHGCKKEVAKQKSHNFW